MQRLIAPALALAAAQQEHQRQQQQQLIPQAGAVAAMALVSSCLVQFQMQQLLQQLRQ
jgi:hypothetical protein